MQGATVDFQLRAAGARPQHLEVSHLPESPQLPQWVSVCYLLRRVKGVLAEPTLPEGALGQDLAQASCELRATTKPTKAAGSLRSAHTEEAAYPKSLCPIYSGRERIFISTSKGNVSLCNTGDEENEAGSFFFFFFFFLEKSVVK